jgi:hypothetical protein
MRVEGLRTFKLFDCRNHNDGATMLGNGRLLGTGEADQLAETGTLHPSPSKCSSDIRQIPGGLEARISFLTGLSNSHSPSPRA